MGDELDELGLALPKTPNWVLIFAVALGAFLATIIALAIAGAFDEPSSEASATRFDSSLVLVGVLVSEIAAIGVRAVTYQSELRTYLVARAEQQRLRRQDAENNRRADDEGERLRMDRILGAVRLMGTDSGGSVAQSQLAGSIQALTRMGEHDMALGSLSRAWAGKALDDASCVSLVEELMEVGNDDTEAAAASLLKKFAENLRGCHFPDPFNGTWPAEGSGVSHQTKLEVLGAVVGLLKAQSRASGLVSSLDELNFEPWYLGALCESARREEARAAATGDDDARKHAAEIRDFATAVLHSFLPLVGTAKFVYSGTRFAFDAAFVAQVSQEVSSLEPGDYWGSRLESIRTWAEGQAAAAGLV